MISLYYVKNEILQKIIQNFHCHFSSRHVVKLSLLGHKRSIIVCWYRMVDFNTWFINPMLLWAANNIVTL